jgi:hypothetical protein
MDRLKAETTNSTPADDDIPTGEDELPLEHAGEGQVLDDPVEDASADSFPASDPPSFTGTTATKDDRDRR